MRLLAVVVIAPLLLSCALCCLLGSAFGSLVHSNPHWSPEKFKKESDSSSCEETANAYVVGQYQLSVI